MKKILNKSCALVLVFVIFMTCMVGILVTKADANSNLRDPLMAGEKLYYITDTNDLSVYKTNYLDTLWLPSNQYSSNTVYNEPDVELFWNSVRQKSSSNIGDWTEIELSYIIFEVSKGIPEEIIENENQRVYTDYLYDLFEIWADNSCEILFISSTDEFKYAENDRNEFLKNARVHVCTDMTALFAHNIFDRIKQYFDSDDISGTTFLLDYNAAGSHINTYTDGWFLRQYLIPHLKKLYYNEVFIDDVPLHEVLEQKNINIICQTEQNSYIEYYSGAVVNLQEVQGDPYVLVGIANTRPQMTESFYSTVYEYTNMDINSSFQYILDPNNYYQDIVLPSNVWVLDYEVSPYYIRIREIIYNMICCGDLDQYNNAAGRCLITNRPWSDYCNVMWMWDWNNIYSVDEWLRPIGPCYLEADVYDEIGIYRNQAMHDYFNSFD